MSHLDFDLYVSFKTAFFMSDGFFGLTKLVGSTTFIVKAFRYRKKSKNLVLLVRTKSRGILSRALERAFHLSNLINRNSHTH